MTAEQLEMLAPYGIKVNHKLFKKQEFYLLANCPHAASISFPRD